MRGSKQQRSAALLLLLCACACRADNSGGYAFQTLTQNEGLSESNVTAVVQDKQGFIWLGTQDGLDRYDGYGFRVFRRTAEDNQSLSESNITALYVDHAGSLWVGTKNGLNRYNSDNETFTRFINRDRNPIVVYAITDAEPGSLWLSTDEGLAHLDTRTTQVEIVYPWKRGGHFALLFALTRDKSGVVWVASDHGVASLRGDGEDISLLPDTRLITSVVTALHEGQDGVLWAGTSTGEIYSVTPDRKRVDLHPDASKLAQSPITSIADSSDGTLWIATENRGLLVRNPENGHWLRVTSQHDFRNGLPTDLITRLLVDRGDKLWVATRGEGIATLNSFATNFHVIGPPSPTQPPLSSEVVHAVLMDSHKQLWVGTENGLDVYSSDFRQVHYYGLEPPRPNSLKGHIIYALYRDHLDQVWVGLLNAGLCVYQPENDGFKCYTHKPENPSSLSDNNVVAITEDRDGYLWLGTVVGGLDRFDPRTGTATSYRYDPKDPHSISSNTVYSIVADPDGAIWAGTSGGGLNRLDPETGRFTRISMEDQQHHRILDSAVLELYRAPDKRLWIGASDGLHVLNTATGELHSWTVNDNLPSNYVDSIAPDSHGLLWLGTNAGLVRFDPGLGVLETFQSTDGLPTDEFNHHAVALAADGTFYQGTMKGAVGFRPDELHRDVPALKVTFTDLLSYGRHVDIQPDTRGAMLASSITRTSSLVLPYTLPAVSLAFSALDAPNPAHVRYAYRFHGLDDKWIYMQAGHHMVDYKPQAAGHFVLEVRAIAANGTALGDHTDLDITVLSPPWLSPLAYAAYLTLLGLLLAWLALRQRHQLARERHQATLTRENEARLQLALWASGEGTWDARPQETVMYCTELMQSLGYRDMPQPVTTPAFLQLLHPDDRTVEYERYRAQAHAAIGVIDSEFRIRNSSGDYVWWKMRGKVVERDAEGNPLRAIGMAKDVTADKEQQTRLQLAALFMENSTDSIVVMDQEYRIIKVNKAFEKMTGYPEVEVLGKFPSFLSASSDAEERALDIKETVKRQGRWNGEGWIRRRSGENFMGRTQVNAILDENGHATHYVGITADITRQRLYEDELRHLASHDVLTGLPNRTLLSDRLGQAIGAANEGKNVGVVLLSLDSFSRVNDSLGHDVGDEVLRETASRLLKAAGPGDTVSRVGGDTFALLLASHGSPEEVQRGVAELLQALSKPVLSGGETLYLSASAGISLYPRDGADPSALIKNAETALFKTKLQSRGAFTWYSPSMGVEAKDNLELHSALHRALDRGELSVHYQPKLRIATGEVCGVEALVRWHDSELSWVSPGEFIPVAETSGLIDRLGEWVLKTACRDMQPLASAEGPLDLAVNLSPKQVQQAALSARIAAILRDTGFPPGRLRLELTENVLMHNPSESAKLLKALREQGIRLAVDDFGTGYSSLGYLRHFPIGEIKVDKSFVQDMENRYTLAIIKAIVALGRSLDMEVTAEGVESRQQGEVLSQLGCTQLQGYLIARPMERDALRRFLRGERAPARA